MKIFTSLDEFQRSAGDVFGPTGWVEVPQLRIDSFADATDDHQWIHVAPARAAGGPFGSTVAHGLLTLSLLPRFMSDLYRVDNVSMVINYGFNKIRFISPVVVGARLRAVTRIDEVSALDGAVQALLTTTVEASGVTKPAAVIESIVRYIR